MAMHELESGNIANPDVTPSHPFTPDVVAWAEATAGFEWDDEIVREAARQILAAVGRW